MTCLTDFGASELSEGLQRGDFSCVELMTDCLDRMDAINPQLNAVVALRSREVLLHEARQADQQPRQGWLHGIPIAIKDLSETKGLTTTYGSALFAGHTPSSDCWLASQLRAAGAIIVGKTNTPEFGLGSHTYNPVYGITRNPYNTLLSAGGSSGGAAAALAARLLPIADGSDMMGSLRNPAAFNNIYGFRPSVGRIPDDQPSDICSLPLSTTGPMGRSIMDITRMLDTLVDPTRCHPWKLPYDQPFSQALQAEHTVSVSGQRIGWIGDAQGHYPMDDELLSLCRSALDVFSQQGCQVEEISLQFDLQAVFDAWCTLRSFNISAGLGHLYHDAQKRKLLKPEAQWEIERGLAFSSAQIQEARQTRSAWFVRCAELLNEVDALCLPSAAVFPFEAEQHWPSAIGETPMMSYHGWMEVVVPASLAGLPALAIPAGFSNQGLPAGVQLIGAYGNDLAMLRLGQAYHLATDWPAQRPPVLAS